MASLHKSKGRNGTFTWRISYYDKFNVRQYLRIGAMGKREAEGIAARVETLIRTVNAGLPLDKELVAWSEKIGSDLTSRLTEHGLLPERQVAKLGEFLDAYISGRCNLRPRTIQNFTQTKTTLVDFFGAERFLHNINSGDAHDWHESLLNAGYANATVSKRLKHAKQFFEHAIAKSFVRSNPFDELKALGERNDARLHFVDRATIEKVLASVADPQWRAIIALSRYGGLRTPSETLAIKWTDIHWDQNEMIVPSIKTKRHNKALRRVPLFPELREFLNAAWDAAAEGSVYVVEKYRDASNSNLRTEFLRILRRAGVSPWERIFHNMRASRQIELCDQFPAHVVSDWLGNSPAVAMAHYLKTTESHFQKAVAPKEPVGVPVGVPVLGENEAHRASPQAREQASKIAKKAGKSRTNFTSVQSLAIPFDAAKYPCQESNLNYDLRRVACESLTLQGQINRQFRNRT